MEQRLLLVFRLFNICKNGDKKHYYVFLFDFFYIYKYLNWVQCCTHYLLTQKEGSVTMVACHKQAVDAVAACVKESDDDALFVGCLTGLVSMLLYTLVKDYNKNKNITKNTNPAEKGKKA